MISFKFYRKKICQPRILYLAKNIFQNKREIKAFSKKQKQENSTWQNTLHEMLEEILDIKEK